MTLLNETPIYLKVKFSLGEDYINKTVDNNKNTFLIINGKKKGFTFVEKIVLIALKVENELYFSFL